MDAPKSSIQDSKSKFVGFGFLVLLTLAGCRVNNMASWADEQAGYLINAFEGVGEASLSSDTNTADKSVPAKPASELTKEERDLIDAWLAKYSLNRYGDAPDTRYASGTPLFNNEGEALDRFKYILEKYPDILNRAMND